MLLTNAQRGDLIDALKAAAESFYSIVDGLTLGGNIATADDPELMREMLDQVKRWRALRRAYLAEERAQKPARVRKAVKHGR